MGDRRQTARDGFVRGAPPERKLARRSLKLLAAGAVLALAALSQLGENGLASWFQLRTRFRPVGHKLAGSPRASAEVWAHAGGGTLGPLTRLAHRRCRRRRTSRPETGSGPIARCQWS